MLDSSDTITKRIASGLGRLALALKAKAWKGASDEGITPTQGEVLSRLAEAPMGMRLSDLAHQLGVSAPTASDAVSALVTKALVEKRSGDDKRSITLTLTKEGKKRAMRAADWSDFLVESAETLSEFERENFLLALVKIIRALQEQGDISPQRMCVSCQYFHPNIHSDAANPHHCAFIDAPFGASQLRLNCADHRGVDSTLREDLWQRFVSN